MRREDLEHLLRAAGAITGSRRVLVIGSQAILGQFPERVPALAVRSMEAGLLPMDAPEMADLLTGTLGELSPFHDSFGYYADGVSLETAVLPDGWQDRLVRIENQNTNGVIGLCLEVHDLLVAKYVAGREKDLEFCAAVIGAGLVDAATLRRRVSETRLDEGQEARIRRRIEADLESHAGSA